MRIVLDESLKKRGSEVLLGNVYGSGIKKKPGYRVVVAVATRDRWRRPWKEVVMIHATLDGQVYRGSNWPLDYVRDHMDLIGRVSDSSAFAVEVPR